MSASSIELALATFREPARLGELRDRPLPEVLDVIKAAAGETATIEAAAEHLDASPDTIREAAVFFLQQLLFAPSSDAYRVLGASSDASQDRLRENYRWLMKWLHPDRNQDGWEVVYADRVNAAWQDLKTPDRRAEYDKRAPAVAPAGFVPRPVAIRPQKSTSPILSGSTVRRLPAMILGGLAALAVATLGLMYWVQVDNERELARASATVTDDASAGADGIVTEPVSMPSFGDAIENPSQGDSATNPTNAAVVSMSEPPPAAPEAPVASQDAAVDSNVVVPPPVTDEPTIAAAVGSPGASIAADSSQRGDPPVEPVVAVAPAASLSAPEPEPAPAPVVDPDEPTVARVAIEIGTDSAPDNVSTPTLAVSNMAAPKLAKPAPPPEPPPLPRPERTPKPAAPAPVVARVQPSDPAPVKLSSATVLAPVAPVEPAPTTPAAPPPSAASVQSTLREFASAYSAGNRQRFDRLFAAGAVNAASLRSMRERMAGAEMRFLEIGTIDVDILSDQAVASASFRDTYVPNGQKKAITESGRMRVSLAAEGATTLIVEFSR